MTTALAYVCSPDREQQLFHSLTTALCWSEGVDRVVVFCVGERPPGWSFADPRVEVREVTRLYGDYFIGNKTYACDVDSDRVLFLDVDTLVLGPLERLWSGWTCDFRGRPANASFGPRWNHDEWLKTCRSLDLVPIPMFNAGVMVFQNRAHTRVGAAWSARLHDYLDGRLPEPLETRGHNREQFALSLAIRQAQLSFSIMGPNEHTFGWLDEPLSSSVVLHTSSGQGHFERYCQMLGVSVSPDLLVT